MKNRSKWAVSAAAVALALGTGFGGAASMNSAGMHAALAPVFQGLTPHEKAELVQDATPPGEKKMPEATPPAAPRTTAPDTTVPTDPRRASPPADTRAEEAKRERQMMLQTAQPMDTVPTRMETVLGLEIRNTQDEYLGKIRDVVLRDGKLEKIVVARGGMLGIGTDYHEIEGAKLKLTADRKIAILDMTADALKAAPKVEDKDGSWLPAAVAEPPAAEKPARTTN